jgi:LacI family transcriptional regulator
MKRSASEAFTQPTMSDVAAMAGVSQMTVSRVVNGTGRVREGTRNKVDVAMAALRYAPNRAARKLAGSQPVRVGVLYGSRFTGDLGEFLVGLSSQARLDHVQLLPQACRSAGQETARLEHMIASGVEGIVLTPLADPGAAIALLAPSGIPTVTVDCGQLDARVGSIGIDGYQAAYEMTRHLAALGHRRIGFVSGSPDSATAARRLAGHLAAVEETGAERDETLLVPERFSYRCGLDAAERLLGLARRPTAIFAGNDEMAAAAVAVAHRLGLDVPGDLTVTGFGDTLLATAIWPELTTIRQPNAHMARAAVQSLARRVRALRQGGAREPEHLCLGYELVRRQSDAAPRVRPQACLAAGG